MLNLIRLLLQTKVIVKRKETIIQHKALKIIITKEDVRIEAVRDMILDYERYMSIKPPQGFDPQTELERLKAEYDDISKSITTRIDELLGGYPDER